MLSYQTEQKLAGLLSGIANAERTVERSRQDLSMNPEFDPYAAFNILDRLSSRAISVFDLKEFVARAGVFCAREELDLLVGQYDNDNDAQLSLTDFFQLVLPSENISLRERAESRRGYMSYNAEVALARHI